MADLLEEELAKRLSLYQTFLRVYEGNTTLIDDILQLEDRCQFSNKGLTQLYLQGMVDESKIYVMTNLSTGETQKLIQPEQIWTIGRDVSNGICVADPYLSNHHGAIQYLVEENSFYLMDFNSTNGSHINGEQIYHPTKLKDGDRIRLGKLSFSFFVNHSTNILSSVPADLLMQLKAGNHDTNNHENDISRDTEVTVSLLRTSNKIEHLDLKKHQHSLCQNRSDILDRFYSRIQNTEYTRQQ